MGNIKTIPGLDFFGGWEILSSFLKSRPGQKYKMNGELYLEDEPVFELNNLVSIKSSLILDETPIKTLGDLQRVGGDLSLYGCRNLRTLNKLEYVGFYLNAGALEDLKDLGELQYVGGDLNIGGTNIETLNKLHTVGKDLFAKRSKLSSLGDLEFIGGHFNIENTPLSRMYSESEIRRQVKVIGKIVM